MGKTIRECWNEAISLGMDYTEIHVEHCDLGDIHTYTTSPRGWFCLTSSGRMFGPLIKLNNKYSSWTLLKPIVAQQRPFSNSEQHSEIQNTTCQCNNVDFTHNAGCGYMLGKYGRGWTP